MQTSGSVTHCQLLPREQFKFPFLPASHACRLTLLSDPEDAVEGRWLSCKPEVAEARCSQAPHCTGPRPGPGTDPGSYRRAPFGAFFFCENGTLNSPYPALGNWTPSPGQALLVVPLCVPTLGSSRSLPALGLCPPPPAVGAGAARGGPLAGAECWQGLSPAGHRVGCS